MRVAIINLTGGGMSGGYRKYLRNVIPRMASNPDVETLLCASPESLNVQAWLNPLPNVEFVNCKPYHFLRHSPDSALKRHLERFSPNVIFVPVERFFRFKKLPVVNMIRNMEPFVTNIGNNSFSTRLRQWVQSVDGKQAIKNADRVIALSKFVSDVLTKLWGVPNERISLVYHGIDINKDGEGHRPHIIPKNWYGRFIFTAGSIRPARGLEDLLLAMKHLASQGQNVGRVVIAGEAGAMMSGYQKKLQDWIQTHNLSSKVCWTSGLNERETAWCYQNCWAFVMTSRVEACPNIALEAMSQGCICIAANNPPLPEFFGDAVIFYPPKDGTALAEAIQTVLARDDNQRKVMSEKAKRRAAKFSWDICAEKTVAVLAKAVESRQSGKL